MVRHFDVGFPVRGRARGRVATLSSRRYRAWPIQARQIDDLVDAGNLADAFCRNHGGAPSWRYDDGLNDGYVNHAPVGRFRPNRFGLHDVIGNVYEWCADWYDPRAYDREASATDGARTGPPGSDARVYRGGAWNHPAIYARSAFRSFRAPDGRSHLLGVRPVMRIVE